MTLNPEQSLLKETVRSFAEKELLPRAARADETETLPSENLKGLADLGLMGMSIPAEYGGGNLDMLSSTIVIQEIARACASTALTFGVHAIVATHFLFRNANIEQRKRFLPELCSGKKIAAWALTEPESGSDAFSLSTRARASAGVYALTGRKTFISNGPIAGTMIVFARTDAGISTFVVESSTPGFSAGKPIPKMGCRASPTSELILDDCTVPNENLLGKEGDGVNQILAGLAYERTVMSGLALGIARASLECAIQYSRERKQFGRAISRFQLVQEMIATSYTDIVAAENLVCAGAQALDCGRVDQALAAACKLFSAGAAVRASMNAMQILGGYGYTREFPAERYLRDAKVMDVGAGTSEIMKLTIARELVGKLEE